MFNYIFKYNLSYKTILLLESDCTLEKLFLKKINNDLNNVNENIILYGSFYYGIAGNITGKKRIHINGVAVYNRTETFLNLIDKINIPELYDKNYDWLIFLQLYEDNSVLKNIKDSKYILNLSTKYDEKVSLNYKKFKPEACIVHTKNSYLLKKLL